MMQKIACNISFLILMMVGFSLQAEGKAIMELKALLEPLKSFKAEFEQTVYGENGKVLQKLAGTVSLKKPAQFRWEIKGQDPRLVISDGIKVWDYDKDLEQVTVQKLDKGQTRAPIFFLTGEVSTLEQDFNITQLQTHTFELKPKKAEGSFQWIRLVFKNKVLKEMEMLDQLGQRSVFIYKNVILNENLPATTFQFTPPRGVDVLKNDE